MIEQKRTRINSHHSSPTARDYSTCVYCGKQAFADRKSAKAAGKAAYPSAHLSAYKCEGGFFHYGNLPEPVIDGTLDRADLNPPRRRWSKYTQPE